MVFHSLKWSFPFFFTLFQGVFTLHVGPHGNWFICYFIPVYRSAISFLRFTDSQAKRIVFMIPMTDSILCRCPCNVIDSDGLIWNWQIFHCLIPFHNVTESQYQKNIREFHDQFLSEGVHASWLIQMGWASVDPWWPMHIHAYPCIFMYIQWP